MGFSVDQFAELLRAVGAASNKTGHEKRRAPRLNHRTTLTIIPYIDQGPTAPQKVQLVDFSSRGLRLLHNKEMKRDSEFLVLLPRKDQKPVPILCTVVHCRTISGGRFSIGAEFVCVTNSSAAASDDTCDRIRDSILS